MRRLNYVLVVVRVLARCLCSVLRMVLGIVSLVCRSSLTEVAICVSGVTLRAVVSFPRVRAVLCVLVWWLVVTVVWTWAVLLVRLVAKAVSRWWQSGVLLLRKWTVVTVLSGGRLPVLGCLDGLVLGLMLRVVLLFA